MVNLPTRDQLQDDPFGFRGKDRDYQSPRGGQSFDPSSDAKANNQARGREPMLVDSFDASSGQKSLNASRTVPGVGRSPLYGGDDLDKMQSNFMQLAARTDVWGDKMQAAQAASQAAQPQPFYSGDPKGELDAALRHNTFRQPISSTPTMSAPSPMAQQPSALQGGPDEKAGQATASPNAWKGNYAASDANGQGIYQDPKTGAISIRLTGDKGRDFMASQVPTARPGGTLSVAQAPEGKYGKRPDGTNKGSGFLGELKMRDGSNSVATEMSIGVDIDGKEMLVPMIVPTLSEQELNHLLSGGKPTPEIVGKAARHAAERVSAGKSPFADERRGASTRASAPQAVQAAPLEQPVQGRQPIDLGGNFRLNEKLNATQAALNAKRDKVAAIERANPGQSGYGSRDYISPYLSDEQARARQAEIYEQRAKDQLDAAMGAQTSRATRALADPTTSAADRKTSREWLAMMDQADESRGKTKTASEQFLRGDDTTRRGQDMSMANNAAERDNRERAEARKQAMDARENEANRQAQLRAAEIQAGARAKDAPQEKARSAAIEAYFKAVGDPMNQKSPDELLAMYGLRKEDISMPVDRASVIQGAKGAPGTRK